MRQLRHRLPGVGQEHAGPELPGRGRAQRRRDPAAASGDQAPAPEPGLACALRRDRYGSPYPNARHGHGAAGPAGRRLDRQHGVAAALPRRAPHAAEPVATPGPWLGPQRRFRDPDFLQATQDLALARRHDLGSDRPARQRRGQRPGAVRRGRRRAQPRRQFRAPAPATRAVGEAARAVERLGHGGRRWRPAREHDAVVRAGDGTRRRPAVARPPVVRTVAPHAAHALVLQALRSRD